MGHSAIIKGQYNDTDIELVSFMNRPINKENPIWTWLIRTSSDPLRFFIRWYVKDMTPSSTLSDRLSNSIHYVQTWSHPLSTTSFLVENKALKTI